MVLCVDISLRRLALASHWPCGTDISGLSMYGLTATEREMSIPPTLLLGHGPRYL